MSKALTLFDETLRIWRSLRRFSNLGTDRSLAWSRPTWRRVPRTGHTPWVGAMTQARFPSDLYLPPPQKPRRAHRDGYSLHTMGLVASIKDKTGIVEIFGHLGVHFGALL